MRLLIVNVYVDLLWNFPKSHRDFKYRVAFHQLFTSSSLHQNQFLSLHGTSKTFVSLLLLLCSIAVFAQSRHITSRVYTEGTSEGLAEACVTVKGTNILAPSEATSNFTFSVSRNRNALVISYGGYRAKEIAIGTSNTVDVHVKADATTLNDVVVFNGKPEFLTGPVSFVGAKQFPIMVGHRQISKR